MRSPHACRQVRAALAAIAAVWMLAAAAAPAQATTWANEQELACDNRSGVRATFIFDPGTCAYMAEDRVAQDDLAGYYLARGFDRNFLYWAPTREVVVGAALWAGCESAVAHPGRLCPSGTHFGPVNGDVLNGRLTAREWNGAFIALVCGNFSARDGVGPAPRITGTKYEDLDGDGTRDGGEPGLGGVRIILERNGGDVAATTTAGDGSYEFRLDANANPALGPGTYTLREELPDGYRQSARPGAIGVGYAIADRTFGGNDFGNYRPARIDGVKYEDMDADGDRDADDPGLEGWTIELGGGPSAPATAVTGSSGTYALTGLRPGTYSVSEHPQPGWRYSAPADGTRTITVRSGDAAIAEFGNYRPATIQGTKFDDHDVDRERDAQDGGLEGWTIGLSGGRSPDADDVTGHDGSYAFSGLIPGSYVVGETLRAGWRQSAPASGTHAVRVRSGDVVTADFGNVCLGTADVRIAREGSGEPLSGVEVRIEEIAIGGVLSNEPPLPRTTSATPAFADLLPGTYRAIAFLPDGVYTTDPDLTLVDGRLAVVKQVTVGECATTHVPIRMFTTSTGKVTGGMRMDVPGGFATAGFVFMTRKGAAEGSLEYIDHATGMNLHSKRIQQIYVIGNEAWIGGLVEVGGTAYRFSLHLVDNGEPGGDDRFELLVESGYRAGYGETIDGGNVQIHTAAGASR